MGSLIPDRQALHDLWHERLKDAKLRLDFARNYAKEVRGDFPPGAALSPDGAFAQQKSLRCRNLRPRALSPRAGDLYRSDGKGQDPGRKRMARAKGRAPR